MIFKKRPLNIALSDKVLEVGPGGSPHPRSDIFLEMEFIDEEEAEMQRSNSPQLKTDKKIVFYDGNDFPFRDKEFDYVICSHVIEHVPNVDKFISELQRVAYKGYLEFPTVYYDYLYNMPTHLNILCNKGNVLYYMTKEEADLNRFKPVNDFFLKTLEMRYTSLLRDLKEYFFQGFEWQDKINIKKAKTLEEVALATNEFSIAPRESKNKNKISKEFARFLKRLGIQKKIAGGSGQTS
jgi:SAM-dependent methyltransferase